MLLKNRYLNGWPLFWLIATPLCILMIFKSISADLTTGGGVSSMIGFSVRFAVPFIFIVVASSAMPVLFPSTFSTWLLRNRKYIGLCFAVGMAWQGLFIAMMSVLHNGYYYEEVFLLRDELEGSVGYIFLTALVVTSFEFGRKRLTPQQWKLLHKSGIYFLWAYPFSTYWWSISYYNNPVPLDYVYYWAGFLAFAARIAAWGKLRRTALAKQSPDAVIPVAFRAMGGIMILAGVAVAATGRQWQESVTGFLTAPQWSENLVLWFPFWPFEPYLSLFIIGLGTMLATRAGNFGAEPLPGSGTA